MIPRCSAGPRAAGASAGSSSGARCRSRNRSRQTTTLSVPDTMARFSTKPRWLCRNHRHQCSGWTSGITTTTRRCGSSCSRARRYSTTGGPSERVAGVQGDQRHVGIPLFPLLAEAGGGLLVLGVVVADRHRDDLVGQGQGRGDGFPGEPGQAADRDHGQRPGPLGRGRRLVQFEQLADLVVGPADPGEQQHEQRDDQDDQPGALGELADQLDGQRGRGEHRAQPVDERPPAPSPDRAARASA